MQKIFEIIIGETKKQREYDVIFENGLPKLSEVQSEEEITRTQKHIEWLKYKYNRRVYDNE